MKHNFLIPYIELTGILPQSIFPILLVLVVGVFFFVMMNAQNSGGGGGSSKMMNFGKSRARLTLDNKVTLKDVAGLQEEKEELEEIS